MKEVGIEDLYGFLGIAADASDKEVGSSPGEAGCGDAQHP